MKEKRSIFKKFLKVLCSLLILLAPMTIVNTASFFLWGEPECPDSLKKSITDK
ncbi:cyclic lactone autoinducer peptide [Tissierella sp. MB52-C2]|uniref:cyclic lactone autoinducer peptide n=1 Tax=Tissierella sp. MB52-C2 TaxID=3070999 RepID=UPI00280ADB8E|nr:cyclic lactone autoinducer peptide [Tissierella sp. MB52-C2]WMM24859.1 cyclic lactone autoinducer peptide [Tissierella sp. MB52-C2]